MVIIFIRSQVKLLHEEGDELVEFWFIEALAKAYADGYKAIGGDAVATDEATHDDVGTLLGNVLCPTLLSEGRDEACDDDGGLRMVAHVFGYDLYLCLLRLTDVYGVRGEEHALVEGRLRHGTEGKEEEEKG